MWWLAAFSTLGQELPSKFLVLRGGTHLEVTQFEIQRGLVVFTTKVGRLQSLPLSELDMDAMERATAARPPASGTGFESGNGGGDVGPAPPLRAGPTTLEGPRAPVAPDVISRDESGRATVRAVRVKDPISLDGNLDEEAYARTPAISGFIQQEPLAGDAATEQTEVWVFFDDRNVYVSARCWDSRPEDMVANELRRDHSGIFMNDNFAVVLDTFYDRRNGVWFYTNPLGALSDGQITDERDTNRDWNTVWDVQTGRFPGGWTVEMEIPFKSLRYLSGPTPIWGINFRRVVRAKNEWSYLTPIDPAFGFRGMIKLSQAASLVGIEPPERTINLEVKPYVKAGSRTDRASAEPFENDFEADVGFDAKYGLTRSLVFDFTYNTDFAEVEDDQQQVNLTRFNLFFPEKRDFFLEGQGIFAFGARRTSRFGGASNDTPIMFFSRRIGLSSDGIVPTRAGGRLTGRTGKYTIGAIVMQTDEVRPSAIPVTNFFVARLKRDIFRRSNVGIIATHRSADVGADSANSVVGVDANFTFYQNLDVGAYYAKSRSKALSGDDESYRARFAYGSDRYGLEAEHLVVGQNFNPEIGFLRRSDFVKNRALARFSPRPVRWNAIRKFTYEGSFDHFDDGLGQLSTQLGQLKFGTELDSGDNIEVNYFNSIEVLTDSFEISDGVLLPLGEYRFQFMRYRYRIGPQRRVSGSVDFQHGGFFSGNRTEIGYRGRVEVTRKLSVEPSLSFNWVDLAEGSFTTQLASGRVNYTHTPRTSLSALVQYNSSNDSLSANIRFRWEYQPGSDLFLVYNDVRDRELFGFSTIANRALIVKFTKLFRF